MSARISPDGPQLEKRSQSHGLDPAHWLAEYDRLRAELWTEIEPSLRRTRLGRTGAEFELDSYRVHVEKLSIAPTRAREATAWEHIVIGGLARSGTTLLQVVLEAAGTGRAPRTWELYTYDATPKSSVAQQAISEAKARTQLVRDLSPRLFGLHPFGWNDIAECTPTLAASLLCWQTVYMFRCPRFERRVRESDGEFAYALWKRQVEVLQPPGLASTLVLKSPMHIGHYGSVLQCYPAARIVQVRRNVEDVARSLLNLVEMARSVFDPRRDPIALGREWIGHLESMLERGSRDWADHGSRVLVVDYQHLAADPTGVVERLGLATADGPVRRRVETATAELRQRHVTALRPLEHFGLSTSEVRRALRRHLDGPFVL